MNVMQRLYLSTIDADAPALARAEGLGLEMAEFCTAGNMDEGLAEWLPVARARMRQANRFIFHAPFAELYPAAIDPRARKLALDRLNQAFHLMWELGIRRMVAHTGYLPHVYFPVWQVERSIDFWREFLADKPADFELLLENVLDETPDMLAQILQALADARAGACLDVGHAFVAGKVPLCAWVAALQPHLQHAHLHDNDGAADLHLPLGEGRIDCEALLRALPETCTLTLENMCASRSIDWLKRRGLLE